MTDCVCLGLVQWKGQIMDATQFLTDVLIPRILMGVQFEATRYAMGTLTVFIGVWLVLSHFIQFRKIRARTPKHAQMWMELKNSLRTILVFVAMDIIIFDQNVMGLFKIYEDVSKYGVVYFWLSIPLILVLHDTYFYWTHRAMHHPKLFKFFHLTHHRSHNPTPFTAYSFAPGEAVVEYLFVPIVFMLIPVHHSAMYIVLTIMIFKNAMGHCGYELMPTSWARLPVLGWMTTVTHHDMHHEKANGNYALYFTWWDRWMGTEHGNYFDRLDAIAAKTKGRKLSPILEVAE